MFKYITELTPMIIMISAVALATCSEAHAGTWGEIHLVSKHGESGYYDDNNKYRDYNETNLGLGMMHGINQYTEVGFGFFENSHYKTALYTGFDIHTTDRAPVRYGVSMGLVSGYSYTSVLLLPNLTIGSQNVRLKIGVLPVGVPLVTLTVGFSF